MAHQFSLTGGITTSNSVCGMRLFDGLGRFAWGLIRPANIQNVIGPVLPGSK